jgi:hypothetical protein
MEVDLWWFWQQHIAILLVLLVTLGGWNAIGDYAELLGHQVHPLVQMLSPNNNYILQDDNLSIHIARNIQSWSQEHDNALQILL